MSKNIPIEVLGVRANITLISFRAASQPFTPVDLFTIWIDLLKSIDGLSGFGIDLPIKDYTKDEFLEAVKSQADTRAKKHLDDMKEEREKNAEEEKKKDYIKDEIKQLKSLIGMD
ncbi:hypothetical protein ES702_02946 [subsurface metagenome]